MYEFIMASWAIGVIAFYFLRGRLRNVKIRRSFIYANMITTAGFFLNIAVMACNGFKMPVKNMVGKPDLIHIPMTSHTVGAIFADYFTVGNSTFSIGDALIVIGSLVIAVLLVIWLVGEIRLWGMRAKSKSKEYVVRF